MIRLESVRVKEMYDLYEIFESLLCQFDVIDMADSEFSRMCVDDPELRKVYREWCREQDLSPRRGFLAYAEEFNNRNNLRMDSLEEEAENYDF